jgi:hypothetical protein
MRSTEREVRALPLGPFRQLADALDRGLVALDAVARQGRPKAKGRARGNDLLQPPRVTNISVLVRVIPLHDDGARGSSPAPWTAGRRPIGIGGAHFRADRADGWMYGGKSERSDEAPAPEHGATDMRLDDHFGSDSTLQRNERVKLAASFWNNTGAGMVIVGMAGAFFLDKPPGTWAKIGIAIGGLVLGWFCYSIASNILTYLHTLPEERR